MRTTIILIFTAIILQSCVYNKEDILYPEPEPDTIISYSKTVSEIILNNCLSCHSNADANNSGAGIKLEDYSDLKIIVDNGKLLGAIKHETGFASMPLGNDKLDDNKISQIEQWINEDAKNN